jgi:ABC-type lipoprotein release transport system permease subunit
VVLDFQYPAGVFQSLKAKVVGIYKTNDSRFDAQQVYVPRQAMEQAGVLQAQDVQEIGVLLHQGEEAPQVRDRLRAAFPKAFVRDWQEVAPELSYIHNYLQLSMSIFMAVVMIAVGFVIANTALMVVLERGGELRMLRAVGMHARRVFWMVQLETLLLALVAGPIGALLGWLTVTHFGNVGIHVKSLEVGLTAYGLSSSIHPALQGRYYFLISAGIMLTALLAAAYPAWRAARSKSVLS